MYKLGAFACLLMICSSCYRGDSWRNLTIKTGSSSFDSSKLVYPATHFLHDIELEFLYISGQLHAYINVYAQTIPPYKGDEHIALLVIDAGSQSKKMIVDRLGGGQRLKIPDESLSIFVQLFQRHSSVVLTLEEGYKTKINTREFKKHFETLHLKPRSFIPNDPIGLAL